MKVVVKDANVLLDLVNGGILGTWLSLGYQNCTTHLVWNEVSQTGQRERVQPFIDSGLIQLRDIAASAWPEIYAFSNEVGVSVPDGRFGCSRAQRAPSCSLAIPRCAKQLRLRMSRCVECFGCWMNLWRPRGCFPRKQRKRLD